MKKIVYILLMVMLVVTIYPERMKYPFIYIPGMFDNGDLLTSKSLLVRDIESKDGFYGKTYFNDSKYVYDTDKINCSSNIVGDKYYRLIVSNLIGPYRTNISLWLMADRLFCLMQGRAPKNKNYRYLTHYEGNDYSGYIFKNNKKIMFNGVIEEVWAKYGEKVHYKFNGKNFIIILHPGKNENQFYLNGEGYFKKPEDIKFNFIVHSSGGIALRRYIRMCSDEKLPGNINTIINLSVPQMGARMLLNLKNGFPALINDTINNFYSNMDTGFVEIKDQKGDSIRYSYKDLEEKTNVSLIHGKGLAARFMRRVIGDYILYGIPFDGKRDVLGFDPALWDLNPKHRMIKGLMKQPLPMDIKIYNYRVKKPFSKLFDNLSRYLKLGESDGVVDFRDTDLTQLPQGEKLNMEDIVVKKANHIPFPYIKPIYELRETIDENYGFLKILVKKKENREDDVTLLNALFKAIMQEMGFDLEYFLKNEDYSVIDYFVGYPVELE